MITKIKRGTSSQKIKKKMDAALSKNPSENIMIYAGSLKTDIDPLTYQKEIRNEWE